MVLKINVFLLLLSFSQFPITEGGLLTKHKKKISKALKSVTDKSKEINLERIQIKSGKYVTEAYALKEAGGQLGHLFIKEVRACSLTGCQASIKSNQDQGYEFFDLSVITDKENVIRKITNVGKPLCAFSPEVTAQVDGISGATISYDALLDSLNEFCELGLQ